jgi:hypothetical protein
MGVVSIQVNSKNINNGSIEELVGSDNYVKVSDQHVIVHGQDAYEPMWVWMDGDVCIVFKPQYIVELENANTVKS